MNIAENVRTTLYMLLMSIIVFCGVSYWRRRRTFYFYASKFNGPASLPLIGSALYLTGGNERIISNIVFLMKKYKSPWKFWVGRSLYIVLTKPEDIEIVFNQALEKPRAYKLTEPVLKEGLFTGPVAKWRRHRKVILKTFNLNILNGFVEIFSEHSQILLERLRNFEKNGHFDAFPVITEATLDITCETAMGIRASTESKNLKFLQNFARGMDLIVWRVFHFWLHPDAIWRLTSYSKELNEISKNIQKFVGDIIGEKKQQYLQTKHIAQDDNYSSDHQIRRKCFLDHLIQLTEGGESWSDEEIMEEAQTMIAAGSESMGTVISFALIMIGMHPSVQNKVYEEVFHILGEDDRSVTAEDLLRMVYLEQVIKETLRLFPVAAVIGRFMDKNIDIGSHTIPEGCDCLVSILHLHRNPEIWEEPLKFKPERFTPEEMAKRHPYSYLPFSGGPRNCIGFKYATMAVKTVVSTVVKDYRISTDFESVEDIEFIPSAVLKAKGEYRIAIERR
ncbi:cytochrome P450 4C1, partial [Asbolus verrucosus]